jgi:glycosyltransferase involved in cell wall biosynthesis
VEFGGVEKVVLNYARVVRDSGCDAHLFVIRENDIALACEVQEVFQSVNFIDHEGARVDAWDRIYSSAGASNCARDDFVADGIGLLAVMDVVLNTHSLAAHSLMAGLRRQGVRTYVGLHLMELSAHGHPMGSPNVALAFEHVYDGFLVISRQLRAWCAARAVPADKILLASNVSSYAADPEAIARAMTRRASRSKDAALRVLFLGRLDAQKGLDRLDHIMRATSRQGFEWRVIGRAVLDEARAGEEKLFDAFGGSVEPPIVSPAGLDEAYGWADAFVLPSRFEGAPLTILEAQRFGCVPLATRVGAVEEMIEDGVDGFLIDGAAPENRIVDHFVERLIELASAPESLRAMAQAGAQRQAQACWRVNLCEWMAHALPMQCWSVHA